MLLTKTDFTITLSSEESSALAPLLHRIASEFPIKQAQVRIEALEPEEAEWIRTELERLAERLPSEVEMALTVTEKLKALPQKRGPMDDALDAPAAGCERTVRLVAGEAA